MTAIVAAVIGVIGAVVAALGGVYFLVERKRIGWELDHRHEYSSGLGDGLKLMVLTSAIHEHQEDGQEYRPTDVAYEFVIPVANTGNRDITESVTVQAHFDEKAKVVLVVCPAGGPFAARDFEWEHDPKQTNCASIQLPFLNRGESDQILVQTVDNSTDKVELSLHHPGIALWRMDTRRRAIRIALRALGAVMSAAAGVMLIVTQATANEDPDVGLLIATTILFSSGQVVMLAATWIAHRLNRVIG